MEIFWMVKQQQQDECIIKSKMPILNNCDKIVEKTLIDINYCNYHQDYLHLFDQNKHLIESNNSINGKIVAKTNPTSAAGLLL